MEKKTQLRLDISNEDLEQAKTCKKVGMRMHRT